MISLPQNYNSLNSVKRKQVRESYVLIQKGNCYHCARPLTSEPSTIVSQAKINWKLFPPGFLKHPVHLHHNHKTGMTIGAVHARCNAYLWQYLRQ